MFVHVVEKISEEAGPAYGATLLSEEAFRWFPCAIKRLIDFKQSDAFPARGDAKAALGTTDRVDESAPGEPLEDLGEVVA